ncbi:2-dehydro-3-deoxygalactonokinase [Xenophilus sp. Marseille-Q4582]|uniref:2-dehydro-3-deoxygalactonokinase n=1 Tax=Xenophilus sp. Marseille-Q4582 TaxID=2866600 RepID=UPI001CE3CCC4|nr:2-dehydro-3-deoxygalactonokinase [Xenophilus sp. Marseille-Q4582]
MTLVAVDWGTSSLRGARIDEATGQVREERSAPRGILTVPAGGFPAVFDELFGDWMREPGAHCLISGMAGSRQGWVEAPYCACPADAADVAQHILAIEPGRIALVPGLSDTHDGVPDVMRGEEVQIFGAMALTGQHSGLFVLPGTHNKWVRVQDGRVRGFHTFMTGEFYALLAQHSILARTLQAEAPLDEAAFLQGVQRVRAHAGGLLHHAFGARTLALFHQMAEGSLASYLSGLLIGEELNAQTLNTEDTVVLVGGAALTQRYALALQAWHIPTRVLGAEATWAGAHALHSARRAAPAFAA